jgi:WD40 repeat protein
VKIYDTKDGDLEHSIKKHTDWVTALEFSPDGVLLATGDRSGGLHVWEARTGRIFYTLNGHKGAHHDVSWRADANLLASTSEDGQVMLWEMGNGTRVKGWQAHPATRP